MLYSYSVFHDTCANDGSWQGQIVCIIHVCGCLVRIGDIIYQSMYELSVSPMHNDEEDPYRHLQ